MEAELKYRETSHYYSNKFMRNSKAVGVLWGIFTVCYAIITIVVFMQVSSNVSLPKVPRGDTILPPQIVQAAKPFFWFSFISENW